LVRAMLRAHLIIGLVDSHDQHMMAPGECPSECELGSGFISEFMIRACFFFGTYGLVHPYIHIYVH